MVEFRLNLKHTAANEPGLLDWLVYIRDNHAVSVVDWAVDSTSLDCFCTIVLATIQETVDTITGFKALFDVRYNIVGVK